MLALTALVSHGQPPNQSRTPQPSARWAPFPPAPFTHVSSELNCPSLHPLKLSHFQKGVLGKSTDWSVVSASLLVHVYFSTNHSLRPKLRTERTGKFERIGLRYCLPIRAAGFRRPLTRTRSLALLLLLCDRCQRYTDSLPGASCCPTSAHSPRGAGCPCRGFGQRCRLPRLLTHE